MSRYLQNKEKFNKYRVVAEYDKTTKDFPRDEQENIDSSFDDIYIRCSNKNRIYSYGKGVLVAYIPSVGRGNNILKSISSEIPFDIEKTDSEILFKFKVKYLDEVATLLKAHLNRTNEDGEYNYISAFSAKNLNKIKVNIPEDKLLAYKNITSSLGKSSMLIIKDINNKFYEKLTNKKFTLKDLKADMKLKGAKGKDYIYLIGKFDDYLQYLEREINLHEQE